MDNVAAVPPMRPAPQLPPATGRDPASTARAFESVFAGQMAKIMMETVPTDGAFSGGHGEEIFRGVLAERMGDAIAQHGGLGIAPAVLGQIIQMQGGKK
jgi:Rod binding domain-containing protein